MVPLHIHVRFGEDGETLFTEHFPFGISDSALKAISPLVNRFGVVSPVRWLLASHTHTQIHTRSLEQSICLPTATSGNLR